MADDLKNEINTFYALKKDYDEGKQAIFAKHDKQSKDKGKRTKSKNIALPKCVGCSKAVGTIFRAAEVQDGEFYGRRLSAVCGDTKSPCALSIQIDIEHYHLFRPMMNMYLDEVGKNKLDIIRIKNDKLFFDDNDAETLDKFTKATEKMQSNMKLYLAYQDQFHTSLAKPDMTNNVHNLHQLIHKNKGLFEEYKQVESTNEKRTERMLDIINRYLHEIQPLAQEIDQTTYSNKYMNVETIRKVDVYSLIAQKNTLDDYIFPPRNKI